MADRRAGLGQVPGWLATQVGAKRFRHIQGVVTAAESLAVRYRVPVTAARWAAWLHDSAKELDRTQLLRWARRDSVKMDGPEEGLPALWHPHAGAAIARSRWGIRDAGILDAIRSHTLGRPAMPRLAQVIFVADFIEPNRDFPGVDEARRAARRHLTEAVQMKCRMTIDHLLGRGQRVHPRLLETWNHFCGGGR